MSKNKKSTYYFIGTISDQSAKYFVSNLCLADGFVLEIMMDGFSIWGSTYKDFDKLRTQITNTLDIIISGFAFRTKMPISYTIKNWIEAEETIAKNNMIGWILNPYANREHHPARSPKNYHWKKSAKLYADIWEGKGNNNHMLALKDYRSALIERNENAFLFAYRSIEDICRAVTGCDDVEKHWNDMHSILGTSKRFIDPLTKVAKKVRHGDTINNTVVRAKKKREKLISIAHKVIEKELKRTFPKFIN